MVKIKHKAKKCLSLFLAVLMLFSAIAVGNVVSYAATGKTSSTAAYNTEYNKTKNYYTDYGSIQNGTQPLIPGIYNGTSGGTNNTPGTTSGTLAQQYVAQGVTYTNEYSTKYYLMTAYDYEGKGATVIYVLNSAGTYQVTCALYNANGTAFMGHGGGIAADATYAYIPSGLTIYCVKLDDLKAAVTNKASADCAKVTIAKTITLTQSITGVTTGSEFTNAFSRASYATYYNGLLWVGEFSEENGGTDYPSRSESYLFGMDMSGTTPVVRKRMTVNNNTQGVAFYKKGSQVYLVTSNSYGRGNASEYIVYNPTASEWGTDTGDAKGTQASTNLTKFVHKNNRINILSMPNMSEDLCTVVSGSTSYLCGIYESAAYPYHGLNANSKSTYVMDRCSSMKFDDVILNTMNETLSDYQAAYDVRVQVDIPNGANAREGCIKIKTKGFNGAAATEIDREEKTIPTDDWGTNNTQRNYYWTKVGFPTSVTVGDGEGGKHDFRISNVWPASGDIEYTMTVYVRRAGTSNSWVQVAKSGTYKHSNGLGSWAYIHNTFTIPTSVYPKLANVYAFNTSALTGSFVTDKTVQIPNSTANPNSVATTLYFKAYDQYNVPIIRCDKAGTFTTPKKAGFSYSSSADLYNSSLTVTVGQAANNPVADTRKLVLGASCTFNGVTKASSINFTVNNAKDYVKTGVCEPTAENSDIGGLSVRFYDKTDAEVETYWLNSSHKFPVTGNYIVIKNNSTRTATIKSIASTNTDYVKFTTTATGSSTISNKTLASGATLKLYLQNGSATISGNWQLRVKISYTLADFYDYATDALVQLESYANCSAKYYNGSNYNDDVYCYYYDHTLFSDYITCGSWIVFDKFKVDGVWDGATGTDITETPKAWVTSVTKKEGNSEGTAKITFKYDTSVARYWQDLGAHFSFQDQQNASKPLYWIGSDEKAKVKYEVLNNAPTPTYCQIGFANSGATATASGTTVTTTDKEFNYGTTDKAKGTIPLAIKNGWTDVDMIGRLPTFGTDTAAAWTNITNASASVKITITKAYVASQNSNNAYNNYEFTCIPLNKAELRKAVKNEGATGGYLSCYYVKDVSTTVETSSGTDSWSKYKYNYAKAAETLGTPNTAQTTINTQKNDLATAKAGMTKSYSSAYVTHCNHTAGGKNSAVTATVERLYRFPNGSFKAPYYAAYKNATSAGLARKWDNVPSVYKSGGGDYNGEENPIEIHYWYIDFSEVDDILSVAPENPINTAISINGEEKTWTQYTTTSFGAVNDAFEDMAQRRAECETDNTRPATQEAVEDIIYNYNVKNDELVFTITPDEYVAVDTFKADYDDIQSNSQYYCAELCASDLGDDYNTASMIVDSDSAALSEISTQQEEVGYAVDIAYGFDKEFFKHQFAYKTVTAPSDGTAGEFTYYCTQCKDYINHDYNVEGALDLGLNDVYSNMDALSNPRYDTQNMFDFADDSNYELTTSIPAPTANSLTSRIISAGPEFDFIQDYTVNYSLRGAQVRLSIVTQMIDSNPEYSERFYNPETDEYDEWGAIEAGILGDTSTYYQLGDNFVEGGTQSLRFRGSMTIPEGAEVTEVGFVLGKAQNYLGSDTVTPAGGTAAPDTFVIGGNGTSQLICGNYTRDTDTYGAYTFNAVVNVAQRNWIHSYAARPYIKYNFGGEEYTVYDSMFSARSVKYVMEAQAKDTSIMSSCRYAQHLCKYMGWGDFAD